MLEDDHSLMGGVMMRGLVDCWTVWTTSIMLYYLVCVCPLDVGIFCVVVVVEIIKLYLVQTGRI